MRPIQRDHQSPSADPGERADAGVPSKPVLIVTGVSLRAETEDRPIAYDLRAKALAWRGEAGEFIRECVVCTDMWWLNNDELRRCPTVSIGAPEVNALTAFLAGRTPSAFTVKDRLAVLVDVEFREPWACCWGDPRVPDGDEAAVSAFVERYFGGFLTAAVERFGA